MADFRTMRSSGRARSLTGAAGRWSASHPWTAIAAWLGAVVVLLVTGHLAGTLQLPSGAQNPGQSGQAEQMINRDFPRHAVENVLFVGGRLRVGDPAGPVELVPAQLAQLAAADLQVRAATVGRADPA
jgi:hypothetical protein